MLLYTTICPIYSIALMDYDEYMFFCVRVREKNENKLRFSFAMVEECFLNPLVKFHLRSLGLIWMKLMCSEINMLYFSNLKYSNYHIFSPCDIHVEVIYFNYVFLHNIKAITKLKILFIFLIFVVDFYLKMFVLPGFSK